LRLVALSTLCASTALVAQTPERASQAIETRSFALPHELERDYNNEIVAALRNMLTRDSKVFLDSYKDVVFVQSTPDQLALAERIIHEGSLPQRSYKLTYTLVETDNGKRVGVQHYSMIVLGNGAPVSIKQGTKIPVATGSFDNKGSGTQTQFTYLDIGMNFTANVSTSASGLYLKSKVEQSSADDKVTISGVTEPVVRQAVLEGMSAITTGRPLTLGSIDITGSTRRIDIEVIAEPTT
jgi:hypothetical protein